MAEGKNKKKKRPGGIPVADLMEPIQSKIATLGKGHKGLRDMENFATLKANLFQKGMIDPSMFVVLRSLASHLEDARSISLVQHKDTQQVFIQKVIHKDHNPDVNKAIANEIDIMHKCVDSNIVQFFGSYIESPNVNIIMEYMDAGCLESLMARVGRIDELPLGAITAQSLEGLRYLNNDVRVLHRDIKPANILINTKGQVKLCDFGVSRTMSGTKTKISTFVGTVRYMAPERLTGNVYTIKSDVWAFGFCLIELAIGRYPLSLNGTDHEVMTLAPKRNPQALDWTGPIKLKYDGVAVMTMIAAICEGPEPKLPEPEKNGFSNSFDEFVKLCTKRDPADRHSLSLAIGHRWLTKCIKAYPDDKLAEYVRASMPIDDDDQEDLDEEEFDLSTAERV